MVLELRYDDIERGVINSRTAGPLSLAAQRIGLRNPRVGKKTISWEEEREAFGGFVMRRVWAALPDNAVRILKRLEYEAKEEILPCEVKRDKRGNVLSIKHKSVFMPIGEGEVQG